MRPLSTRAFKLDASYKDIMASVDTHRELKAMKRAVMEESVVFFVYRGGDDTAMVMMNVDGEFCMHVKDCSKVKRLHSDPDLLYALCYGV